VCKLIAELAGADKQVLSETVHRLEMASGSPGVDVRLTGEIYGKLHMKMRELGLDPNDTTPQELYRALHNLVILHDKFIADKIGIKDRHNPQQVLQSVVNFANNAEQPMQTWALKQTAMKRLLKNAPPKHLMKYLNYRSVDSMLKREPIGIVMNVARHIEPYLWQQKITKAYKNLTPSDFETKKIDINYMSHAKWDTIGKLCAANKTTAVFHLAESGSIAVIPMPLHAAEGLTLASLLLIFHYVNEIRSYGTYFKFHHMRGDFGQLLVNTISQSDGNHAQLGTQSIHWRVVHRYYGSGNRLSHPEIFEPHVQPEDLFYRKAEALLYKLEPALHFWHNTDYVGLPLSDGPLSFNLADMALNTINRIPYEKRANYHLREAVWNELYCRYMGQRSLELQLLQDLDEETATNNHIQVEEFVW
jgi:hypothetical protein